jgi:hypothetical protein
VRRLLLVLALAGCGGTQKAAPPSAHPLPATPATPAKPDLIPATPVQLHYEDENFSVDVVPPAKVKVGERGVLRIIYHPKGNLGLVTDPSAPNRIAVEAPGVELEKNVLKSADAVKLEAAEAVFEVGFKARAAGQQPFKVTLRSATCAPDVCHVGNGTLSFTVLAE